LPTANGGSLLVASVASANGSSVRRLGFAGSGFAGGAGSDGALEPQPTTSARIRYIR